MNDAVARGRHRKPKAQNIAMRHAITVAAAVPVAGAILLGQSSAFAAEAPAASTAPDMDTADHQIAADLDTRVHDAAFSGSEFSGIVIDARSDQVVWDHDAATALMPASNAKLATATAALTVLGPHHRFTTRAVYSNGVVTLVGGGDRVLSTADLAQMAELAVAKLKHEGERSGSKWTTACSRSPPSPPAGTPDTTTVRPSHRCAPW